MSEPISGQEARLLGEIRQLDEWNIAEHASTGLAQVLLLNSEPQSFTGSMKELAVPLVAHSQQIIGIRMFRAIRAAMAVLAAGYEPEARAHDRVLVELVTHRKVILEDPSGAEAQRWLEGKSARGISGKVNAMHPSELYSNLCQDSHGDPRGAWRLYDAGSQSLIFGPHRDVLKSRASLLMYAGSAIAHTQVLAQVNGLTANWVAETVERVTTGWDNLKADTPESDGADE